MVAGAVSGARGALVAHIGTRHLVLSVSCMKNPTFFRTASVSCLLVVSACASSKGAEVKDEQLSQLPHEDRQAIIDQERSVEVAKANADAARVAAKQADEFKVLVDDEVVTAKAQRDEAANAASYTNTKQAQNDIAARRELAAQQVTAAEAKSEYADKLIEVRQAEVEEREAEADLAQARYERVKYVTLQQRGMAKGIDRQAIEDSERQAEQKRAEAHQKVSLAQGYADVSKGNWDKSQAQYQSAAKATGADERPVQPPAAAKYLPAKPVQEQPTETESTPAK
jgi:hypothetical protein